jgi:hypothetical protein
MKRIPGCDPVLNTVEYTIVRTGSLTRSLAFCCCLRDRRGPAIPMLVTCGGSGVLNAFSSTPERDGMFLAFAVMWLPFVLISGWAFFYLRQLRNRTSSAVRTLPLKVQACSFAAAGVGSRLEWLSEMLIKYKQKWQHRAQTPMALAAIPESVLASFAGGCVPEFECRG